MSRSPAVILYDEDGNVLALEDGDTIPAGTKALHIAGKDGSTARFIRVASDGTVRTDPTGTTAQPITDNGGSLTVDGTVTANAGTGPWPVTDNGGSLTVDATSLPLPTGASTSANQSTIIGHVDGIEGLLASIKDTDGIKKITDPLPAGTNNIGDVDVVSSALPTGASTSANQSTIIGHVDQIEGYVDGIEGTLTSIKDTDGIKKITDALPAGSNKIGAVNIQDSGGSYLATVTNAGQLRVTTEGAPPPGYTQVNRSMTGDLTGVTTEDDVYTIPNTKKLIVTRCSGTAYASASGDKATKLELFYDPNGNGTGMSILRAAIMSNNAIEFTLAFEATGDGTKAIRLRRESLDSQTRYAPVFWDGIVES